MKSSKFNLPALSIDELWALHEEVGAMLSEKITVAKRALEDRLARLKRGCVSDKDSIRSAASQIGDRHAVRRKYPPVLPKFQNPSDPTETWAGRGKRPRWLVSELKAGKKIDDFRIAQGKRRAAAKRRSA